MSLAHFLRAADSPMEPGSQSGCRQGHPGAGALPGDDCSARQDDRDPNRTCRAHASIGHGSRLARRPGLCQRHQHSRCASRLARNNTVSVSHTCTPVTPSSHSFAWGDTAPAALNAAIKANSRLEPMPLASALHVIGAASAAGSARRGSWAEPAGGSHEEPASRDHTRELRMNLGGGRNAVYVAPCEQHLECPLDKKGKYVVHTNRPKIMTDMSKVEFGICIDDWRRLVFKTVNDPALAKRELSFYRKIAPSRSPHLIHLLDEFTDNQGRHVMVFPRMNSACILGHDLAVVAHIAHQLFAALRDLHCLGIAHMDITPTNLMTDPNDASHIEVIDFGLACDVAETTDGRLPSRGTCGFVAPEVLAGSARDLRADTYSAGVVLGMMLQQFLPTINLRLLGGPLVRSDTTDDIVGQLDELLEAYQYRPALADFVECATTFVGPSTGLVAEDCSSSGTFVAEGLQVPTPARSVHFGPRHGYSSDNTGDDGDNDDSAAALAAVYSGGPSLYRSYGDASDSDSDEASSAGHLRFSGYNAVYGRTRGRHARQTTGNSSADEGHSFRSQPRYTSPPNTPVHRREEHGMRQTFSLSGRLARTAETHSNARYVAAALAGRTPLAVRSGAAASAGGCVGKPGRVPLALLHAADLLRWALQADPQWRPTAAQALDHPFLRAVAGRTRPAPMPRPEATAADADGQSSRRVSPVSPHDGEPCLLCGSGRAAESGGGAAHMCAHGGSSVVMSECNSRASSPSPPESPRPTPAAPPALRDSGMFKESALCDVRLWVNEMHARVAHVAHGDRSGGEASSFDHGRDSTGSMFADADITSYYH